MLTNFIAKPIPHCTEMFCGARYIHHTFTPIAKHEITTTAGKRQGKKSLINKYIRNPTGDIKLPISLIKFSSLRGLPNKYYCPNKILRIIYNLISPTSLLPWPTINPFCSHHDPSPQLEWSYTPGPTPPGLSWHRSGPSAARRTKIAGYTQTPSPPPSPSKNTQHFKLKVNGRAVTSQTGPQPNVEVGSVRVSTGQPTWKKFQFESPGMKLLFSSWAFVYFPPCYFVFLERC